MTGEVNSPSRINDQMSFWDHVDELRGRLIKIIIGLVLTTGTSYVFWRDIWVWLAYPLEKQHLKVSLIAISPLETFLNSMKISIMAGLVISLPWTLWQLWSFIGPALFPNEKRIIIPSVLASLIMFLIGASFSYFIVLPLGLNFFATYTEGMIEQTWKQADYVGFIGKFLISFGVVFELPVIAFVLAKAGLINAKKMWSFFKYAIILIFIIAALLTPGPDPISQVLLAIPLIVLYLGSIGLCKLAQPRQEED